MLEEEDEDGGEEEREGDRLCLCSVVQWTFGQ